MSGGGGLLVAAIDRFLVFGIFTNLAIFKDMSSRSFHCNYLRGQSNDSAFANLKE